MQGNAARTARNARKTPAGIAAEQCDGAFAVCEVGAYQMRPVIKPSWVIGISNGRINDGNADVYSLSRFRHREVIFELNGGKKRMCY